MNRAALYDTEIDDAYIALLTLTSAGTTIRVTDWDENVSSGGVGYRAESFQIVLPASGDDSPPRATVRVDNASLAFVSAIRSVTDVMGATLSIVAASDPETIELGPLVFECRLAKYDAGAVELDLTYEPILNLAVPHHVFGPGWFPGLFR